MQTAANRRSAPFPGRYNVAKPSGIGLANARRRLDPGTAAPRILKTYPKVPPLAGVAAVTG